MLAQASNARKPLPSIDTWLSKAALDAQVEAEGNGADTVVWAEVGSAPTKTRS